MLIRNLILIALAAATVWLCKTSPEVKGGGAAGVIMKLPAQVGHFAGEKGEPDPVELAVLPGDTEITKMVYCDPAAGPQAQPDIINVSVVLSGAYRQSIHRPEVCLQGQGWSILGSRVLPIDVDGGRNLRILDLYISKPVTLPNSTKPRQLRAHYFYWFVGTGISTPYHAERTWITLRDSLLTGINHRWAYASVMAIDTDDFTADESHQRPRTDEQTVEMLRSFIGKLAPRFQKEFMPPT